MLQMYNPVLAWANQHFDVKFAVSNSIFGARQNPETHQAVNTFLQGTTHGALGLPQWSCLH